jgi:hypothetical protein
MTVSRADALSYLVGTYGTGARNLLSEASVPATDTAGGLKEPIDSAYLLLFNDADLIGEPVEGTSAEAFYAALDYTALTRVLLGLNRRLDVDVGAGDGITVKGSQLTGKVQWMLTGAANRCIALGLRVAVAGVGARKGWGALDPALDSIGWSTDFIEPDSEEFVS